MPCLITHVCNVVGAGPAPHLRSVLVKGSRFMRMERVVQALQALACREQQEPKDAPHAA
jgi:UDP-N-acetylmuramoyl-tripeptide--D-alanyl-D-alanine ligase